MSTTLMIRPEQQVFVCEWCYDIVPKRNMAVTELTETRLCEDCYLNSEKCGLCKREFPVISLEVYSNVSVCHECNNHLVFCHGCDKAIHEHDSYRADRKTYCYDCYEDLVECNWCGTRIASDEVELVADFSLCRSCYENSTACENCRDIINIDDSREYNGETYCRSCYEEIEVECNECGTDVRRDYAYEVGGDYFCENCYNERYFTCEDCGRRYLIDDDRYEHDTENCICYRCASGIHHIHGYHRRSNRLLFYTEDTPSGRYPTENKLYMGVELETDKYDNRNTAGDALFPISKQETLFALEDDGSLSNGIEIITQPCTLQYHKTAYPWDDIIQTSKSCGGRSHDTNTCGLHIHINDNYLGDDNSRDFEKVKICYLYEKFWGQIVKFSRRSDAEWRHYANNYSEDLSHHDTETAREFVYGKKGNGDRYLAVNLCPDYTVEFRIFKGSLIKETIFACLEFTDFLVNYAKNNGLRNLRATTWSDFTNAIDKEKYNNLIPYMESRGLIEVKEIKQVCA